jgi:sigma-B regulation protein RsbU (phosphoserine phosphatase)
MGHPHAFVFRANGERQRLPALDPPLGMVHEAPSVSETAWESGKDLLVLFTDGICDALNARGDRIGEEWVLDLIGQHRAESPAAIVNLVFTSLQKHIGDVPLQDDLTLLVLRS